VKKTKEVGGATDNLCLESDNQVYISESSLSLAQNSGKMESSMKSKHSPAQIHKDFKQTSNKNSKNERRNHLRYEVSNIRHFCLSTAQGIRNCNFNLTQYTCEY